MTIAVVTDSSAYLPTHVAVRGRVFVVPLHVAVDGVSHDEGVDVSASDVAAALREHRPVSTSRPSPGAFLEVYEDLIARGVDQIVSIHLSRQMSATLASAEIAAASCDADVRVIDSESIGMAMGFAVLAAAGAVDDGATVDEVERIARDVAATSHTYFYVDTLEYLRRGGRIGRAPSLVGSALSIKPLLTLTDGYIEPLERVRTTSKALARLKSLARQAAVELDSGDGVDVAVHHLDALERAEQLAEDLAEAVPDARRVLLVELGAAVGAHVGPGTIAVAVAPRCRAPGA
ncbi:DegV family protein with EDD domain [Yimella lutea]|uniref:DegV family protein with EDD domain n=1 Tax=Yimella lutea TaxID=587872 RepID=A0A542EFK9_9MICO|nr:DegV family protein [Yimella lutea]TQJ14137.1 DegV family protein with EDD domain [Yimella lutea]